MFQFSPKPQKERKLRVFFFFSGGFTQQFFVFVVSDHVFVPNGWETKNNSGRKTPKKKSAILFESIVIMSLIINRKKKTKTNERDIFSRTPIVISSDVASCTDNTRRTVA